MASNIRVLVSNLGDGNWGVGATTGNQLNNANGTLYFPPGTGSAEPTVAQRFGGSVDYIGWSSKTNWMVQAENVHAANGGRVQVIGHRPSGVSEELVAGTVLGAGISLTSGGLGGEEIYGPFTHFSFVISSNTGTLDCYVTAWNYGDILDAGA
tara:strand:+ start:1842 stop:2300 length:459 start_codon:yes stop_codon:yes gene_type:complete